MSAELTLTGLFDSALRRFTNRIAVVVGGRRWTYGEIVDAANRLAQVLVSEGVGVGDRVALLLRNGADYVIADQAVIRCGAAKVAINDQLTRGEIETVLRDSGAIVAIADPDFVDVAAEVGVVLTVGSALDARLARADPRPPDVPVAGSDIAMIAYTGGTTGRQKGVVHTQAGLAANVLAHAVEMGLADDERLLLTTPLPHSAGYILHAGLCTGATAIIERRFEPAGVLDRIERDRITVLFMVPTMIYRLLDHLEHRDYDLSSLRTILYGAAPITTERLRQGLDRIGRVFMQLYGQTEAPNFLTRLTREDHDPAHPRRLTSCGRPTTMTRIAVLDDNDEPVPPGTPGEICARAPYVMSHYHELPEKTAETLRGGWLHTGDLGQVDDDGYVYLLDRKNDMIITGGMNVYCTEVENVLQECPGIAQIAVTGVAHPDWGEAVTAFVVPADSGFDEATAAELCRERLAAYKRPKEYRQLDVFPVTPYGKIDKKTLRGQ